MAEAVYPMLRVRSRRRRRMPAIGRRAMAAGVLVAAVLAIAAFALRARPERDPRRAFADAAAALARGNYSAARNDAMAAITADPASPTAHVMLARTYLLLGDGLAAEAELDRAHDRGVPDAMLDGLRAHAKLLQGDVDGALAAAASAPATDLVAARTRARALAAGGQRADAERLLGSLIAAHPRDARAIADLGQIRLDAGDVGGAAPAAARAARLAPYDPVALTLQGQVVRTRYGLLAALPWFEAALKRDAYHHAALIEYAATLGDLGRYSGMLAATRKALAARPGSPQALYLQSVLAARAGKTAVARALLIRAGPIDQQIPGAMLLSGGLDYRDERYEQAIADWRRLVGQQPMNLVARRLLAAALLRSGDPAGALDTLGPLLGRDDADVYALTLAARALERLGDRAAAGRLLDRAATAGRGASIAFGIDGPVDPFAEDAALAPGDPALAVALVRARVATGDADGGVEAALALVMQRPGDPVMLRALGDALVADGRLGDAIDAYTRAANLAFDEPTMLRLVDALGRSGHAREAAATLALYLQQNPQSIVAEHLRAHWLVTSGQGAAAVATLEKLRRMAGDRNAALLTDLALAHTAAGEAAIGRRYARAAYALAPLDPAVVDAYGLALIADRNLPAARQMFAKALVLAPDNAVIAAHAWRAAR